jgi:Family of unknown function (DUF6152)
MRTTLPVIIALLASLSGPVAAHHSPAAFDMRSSAELGGEVARFDWKNPHVYIVVKGSDDSGRTGEWLVEGSATPLMTRSGWSASTLVPGDRVSITLHPDRNQALLHGLLVTLTTADGRTLGVRAEPVGTTAKTSSIAGVWNAIAYFGVPFIDQNDNPPRVFTEAGLAARAAYTPDQNPAADCLAYPTPMITILPYLYKIDVLADRVLIRSEFFDVERTVYMDGHDHPADGPRTIQGHSIGHWEGKTLVVDTRLYADYRIAHGWGVPSGAQKHTVERYALSPDGTKLDIEILVEDPEFVAAPYTITTTWDYTPDGQLQPSVCDLEDAKTFIIR